MNRREALQASLAALPFTGRLEPSTGDVVCVVFESDVNIDRKAQSDMVNAVKDELGKDVKVFILCPGLRVKVVRLSEADVARLDDVEC